MEELVNISFLDFFFGYFQNGAKMALDSGQEFWNMFNKPFGTMIGYVVEKYTGILDQPDSGLGEFTFLVFENTIVPFLNFWVKEASLLELIVQNGIFVFVVLLIAKIVIDIVL